MPNRFQRNSIGELVCRVPLNRGSLLKSIENLVKTIETSENAVMIPTLLRDKVRVDAWELLFVAKILKASILGHDDLVEFYMNHIHQNSLSTNNAHTPTHHAASLNGQATPTPNGTGELLLSPSLARHQSSPSMASPRLLSHLTAATATTTNGHHARLEQEPIVQVASSQSSSSAQHHSASSVSSHSSQATTTSSTATTTATGNGGGGGGGSSTNQHGPGQRGSTSSASWMTAQQSSANSLSTGSPFNSSASSSSASSTSNTAASGNGNTACELTTTPEVAEPPQTLTASLAAPLRLAPEEGLLAARPLVSRLAQPPSLLQLTTTNNHLNSVTEMLNSSPLDPSLDSLSQHLISLQQQQQQQTNGLSEPPPGLTLSILTSNGQTPSSEQHTPSAAAAATAATTTTAHVATPSAPVRHELRSSRSAGCLFRANSGASSPRTPGTPYPQAETLAGAAAVGQNGLVGDPTSLPKLLFQVEQLKASIVHVNMLLESVVDLYKKSIDNISQ